MVCAKAQGGRKPVSKEGQSDWRIISKREGKAGEMLLDLLDQSCAFILGVMNSSSSENHDPADALISDDWTGPCLSGSLYRL